MFEKSKFTASNLYPHTIYMANFYNSLKGYKIAFTLDTAFIATASFSALKSFFG